MYCIRKMIEEKLLSGIGATTLSNILFKCIFDYMFVYLLTKALALKAHKQLATGTDIIQLYPDLKICHI